jgi:hypothetical protein
MNATEQRIAEFVSSLLNPEQHGYAVSPYIRDQARMALGLPLVETTSPAGSIQTKTPTAQALLAVLSADAQARHQTAMKTASIMTRDYKLTGFVVTNPFGHIGIIDKSACRWLTANEMDQLMHPRSS